MSTLYKEMKRNDSMHYQWARRVATKLSEGGLAKDMKELADRDYYFDGTRKEKDDVRKN